VLLSVGTAQPLSAELRRRVRSTLPDPVRGTRQRKWGDTMAVGIFAGIPVRDYDSALEWYKRLLGAEPAFYPNDVEAVWQLA
jgi:hypothetical protein